MVDPQGRTGCRRGSARHGPAGIRGGDGPEAGRPVHPAKPIKQKGGKIVHAWAFEGDCDPPPSGATRSRWSGRPVGRQQEFPEIDRAEWFDLATARKKIKAGQEALIDELEGMLHGR